MDDDKCKGCRWCAKREGLPAGMALCIPMGSLVASSATVCPPVRELLQTERERDEMRTRADHHEAILEAALATRDAEVERLRKALAPFAKAAERIPDFGPHAKAITDILAVNWKDGSLPMFGTEFHRARAALEGEK